MNHPSEHFDSPEGDDLVAPELGLSDQDEADLNDELAELLAESVEAKPESRGGVDLDDLLAESMESVQGEKLAKAAKERIKRGGQSAVERAEDAARIAAWEAAHEWLANAAVAMFTDLRCQCGASTRQFTGLFTREVHRHLKVSQRWRRVEAIAAHLVQETAIRIENVPMCGACAFDKGWDLGKAYIWEDR